jgi:hypothetical protein
LDKLRAAARTSESARRLLAQIDPRGDLRFTDDQSQPVAVAGLGDEVKSSTEEEV